MGCGAVYRVDAYSKRVAVDSWRLLSLLAQLQAGWGCVSRGCNYIGH